MSDDTHYDLIVVGAGPGGYVAAIRAAQLGMDVACVDENEALGGTCLRVGCIPSKALLESSERYAEAREHLGDHGVVAEVSLDLERMMARKAEVVDALTSGIDSLFDKNGVTAIHGRAHLTEGREVVVTGEPERTLTADHVLLATGSRPAGLKGVEEDGDRIGSSTAALSWDEVPDRLVVIGAGYIGLELGSVWRRLGAEVIVLEALDRILPGMDGDLGKMARRAFEKQGLEIRLGARVEGAKVEDDRCVVRCEDADPIDCDRVLVATGRIPNTGRLGLEEAGVTTDERGFIDTDETFATSAEGVYAIGDCIGGAMLAHKASDEGVACVEGIAGHRGHVNYDAIPAVVYTHPEIASVGKTEEALKEAGVPYRKGVCPYGASGRARALGDTFGRVKVLAHRDTDRILGVHIIGLRAGDLIAEATAAMAFGASAEDIGLVSHAHPTLAEVLHEAALAVDDRPIHT